MARSAWVRIASTKERPTEAVVKRRRGDALGRARREDVCELNLVGLGLYHAGLEVTEMSEIQRDPTSPEEVATLTVEGGEHGGAERVGGVRTLSVELLQVEFLERHWCQRCAVVGWYSRSLSSPVSIKSSFMCMLLAREPERERRLPRALSCFEALTERSLISVSLPVLSNSPSFQRSHDAEATATGSDASAHVEREVKAVVVEGWVIPLSVQCNSGWQVPTGSPLLTRGTTCST